MSNNKSEGIYRFQVNLKVAGAFFFNCNKVRFFAIFIHHIRNPLQNIWDKVKKSSKLEQDFKDLLPNFACFFTAIVKV